MKKHSIIIIAVTIITVLLVANIAFALDLSGYVLHPGKLRNSMPDVSNCMLNPEYVWRQMVKDVSGSYIRSGFLTNLLNPNQQINEQILPKPVENQYKDFALTIEGNEPKELILPDAVKKFYYQNNLLLSGYGMGIISDIDSRKSDMWDVIVGNKTYSVKIADALSVERINSFYNFDISRFYSIYGTMDYSFPAINVSYRQLSLESFQQFIFSFKKISGNSEIVFKLLKDSGMINIEIIDKIIECLPNGEDLSEICEVSLGEKIMVATFTKDHPTGIDTEILVSLNGIEATKIVQTLFAKLREKFISNLEYLQHRMLEDAPKKAIKNKSKTNLFGCAEDIVVAQQMYKSLSENI